MRVGEIAAPSLARPIFCPNAILYNALYGFVGRVLKLHCIGEFTIHNSLKDAHCSHIIRFASAPARNYLF